MYESPIDIIYNDIQYKVEEEFEKSVISAMQSYGIDVNKEELLNDAIYTKQDICGSIGNMPTVIEAEE